MYLRADSLERLQGFFSGYEAALRNCGMEERACILPWEFHGSVAERYGQPGPKGWCRSILEAVPDGRAAIATFFTLLDMFLEANGFARLGE